MNTALHAIIFGLPVAPVWAQLLGKATLVLALGWAIHATLGRANPRWRVLLWRVVAVGLALLPVSIWGPSIEFKIIRPAAVAVESVTQPDATADAPRPIPNITMVAGAGRDAPPVAAQPTITAPTRASHFRIPVPAVVACLWAMGVVAIALRCVVGWRRLRAIARQAMPAPEALTNVAARVAWDLGGRGLDLRLTEGISIPFVMGWRRPVLLLPARMAGESYREQLPAILAHEFSHLRAGDMFWSHALAFARMLLWFHPFIWKAPAAHAAACEEVSDAISAAYIGDAGAYSRTLARVAVELAELPSPVGGIAMARVPEVMRRLACLRRHVFAKSISRQYLAAFVLAFMLGALLIGSLRFAYAQSPATPEVAKSNEAPLPEQMVLLRVTNTKGETLPGASIRVRQDNTTQTLIAEGGTASIRIAPKTKYVSLLAEADDCVSAQAVWSQRATDPVPAEYTFRLEKGITIGGVVKDEKGKPVEGASVEIFVQQTPYEGRRDWPRGDDVVKTDADGRWEFKRMSPTRSLNDVQVTHPDYASSEGYNIGNERLYPQLRAGTAVVVMKKGVALDGLVVDAKTGRPIKAAKVMWMVDRFIKNSVVSGDDGRFVFAAVDKGEGAIAATAPLHAPEIIPVSAEPNAKPVRIALGPGHVVEGRVVDGDGKPAPNTLMYPHTWRNVSNLFDVGPGCWFVKADGEGRFRWTEAPEDAVLASVGGTNGTICDTKYPLVPGRDVVITVQKLLTVSGEVTDAETGQPIKSFKVAPGTFWRFSTDWWRDESAIGKDGRYKLESNRGGCQAYQLEFSAEGYQTVATREFHYQAGGVVCDVKLRKDAVGTAWLADSAGRPIPLYEKTPESKVEGRVVDPAGKTHQNLDFFMCTPDSYVTVCNGKAVSGGGWTAHLASSGNGHFEMTAPFYPPYEFIVVGEWGYADVNDRELRKNPEIRLNAWGKLQGTVSVGGKPAAGMLLRIKYDRPFCDASDPNRPKVWFDDYAQTDSSGKFVFERLMAGPVHVVGEGIDEKAEVNSGGMVEIVIAK
ncbi:M56 family metallopeptidase [bacterium]|nr:M56 family metallopeptidase [bacterium]